MQRSIYRLGGEGGFGKQPSFNRRRQFLLRSLFNFYCFSNYIILSNIDTIDINVSLYYTRVTATGSATELLPARTAYSSVGNKFITNLDKTSIHKNNGNVKISVSSKQAHFYG